MLRFVTEDGNFEERFLHFRDMSWSVCWSIISAPYPSLAEFDCVSKLVAQTYDGVAVMVGEHAGMQSKLPEVCKNEIFVHYYAHRLNLVLSQSLSYLNLWKYSLNFCLVLVNISQSQQRGLKHWIVRWRKCVFMTSPLPLVRKSRYATDAYDVYLPREERKSNADGWRSTWLLCRLPWEWMDSEREFHCVV